MKLTTLAGATGVAVAICAVCGHAPGPIDSPPDSPVHSISAANYTSPGASNSSDPDVNRMMEDVRHAFTDPTTPAEDAELAAIHAKYGPFERQPGESGASWCHRQRLTSQAAGADISEMGCQVDDVNYPDPVLSPNAEEWH